jgi:hypothetical protein
MFTMLSPPPGDTGRMLVVEKVVKAPFDSPLKLC